MTHNGPIVLQHMLHGYDDGHRLLASSVKLEQADMKTMLRLTDSSGPGIRSDADSYVTGYPLPLSGCFALAKTWPAPELPRPGCVWTHSLLIDFADLAVIGDFAILLESFVRPSGEERTYYSTPKLIDVESLPRPASWDPEEARQALAALYMHPGNRVLMPRVDTGPLDGLVLAIWSQQWPRLRRSFRFCTNAVTDRSGESNAFDFQLVDPSQGVLRSRFPKGHLAEEIEQPAPVWLELAVRDLMAPNRDGLRQFLRQIGGDVQGGREAFPYLTQLHADLLAQEDNFSALSNAIDLLTNELASVEATTIRSNVVNNAVHHVAALDDAGIDFLIIHLDLISRPAAQNKVLGQELMQRAPNRFLELLNGKGTGRSAAESAFSSIPLDRALNFAEDYPTSLRALVQIRTDWAESSTFWTRKSVATAKMLASAKVATSDHLGILGALLAADRIDLVPDALDSFGSRLVLKAIIPLVDKRGADSQIKPWLNCAVKDISAVSETLAAAESSVPRTLEVIARLIHPDDVVNDVGEDPWLAACRGAEPKETDLFLLSFLLARALGSQSQSQAELAVLGFTAIHDATARGQLRDECWSMFATRLPTSLFGFDWDRCWRLRTGLIDMFLERRLSPETFAFANFNDELFFSLAHWAKRSKQGEDFLKSVHEILKTSDKIDRTDELARILR